MKVSSKIAATNVRFFLSDDTLQKKVNCTACGKQVNQFQRNSVYEHPALKVLICRVGNHPTTVTYSVQLLNYIELQTGSSVTTTFFLFCSHATSITQAMTSAETLMGWTSSAGMEGNRSSFLVIVYTQTCRNRIVISILFSLLV